MIMKTDKTDNELIAEFMEYTYHPVKAGYERGGSYSSIDLQFKSRDICLAYCDQINEGRSPENCYFPLPKPTRFCDFTLKYDTSWDWLMPVVIKIEEIEMDKCWPFQVEILSRESVQIIDNRSDTAIVFINQDHAPKIESVYKSVVQFIKWYNS